MGVVNFLKKWELSSIKHVLVLAIANLVLCTISSDLKIANLSQESSLTHRAVFLSLNHPVFKLACLYKTDQPKDEWFSMPCSRLNLL